MASLQAVLGPHAYILHRYGISLSEDVETAIEKLRRVAPHMAKLLEEVVRR